MGEMVCIHCGEPIASRSTYIPTEDGPQHPFCWERNYLTQRNRDAASNSKRYARDLASERETYTVPWW